MEKEFYNREIMDEKLEAIHQRFNQQDFTLDKILQQTTAHNGRMKKIEKTLLIVGCVTGTLLLVNGSELIGFLMQII